MDRGEEEVEVEGEAEEIHIPGRVELQLQPRRTPDCSLPRYKQMQTSQSAPTRHSHLPGKADLQSSILISLVI